jgi:type III secretion protein J
MRPSGAADADLGRRRPTRPFFATVAALVLAGCAQRVQTGLDEAQANEIEAVLQQAGIDARKVREGGRDARWAVEVPSDRAAAAVRLLAENDLPRQRAPGFAEVFGKGSMVPTATEEHALFLHALSGELSRTLSAVEGVATARVHLVVPPPGPPSTLRPPAKPRASVLLKARAGRGDEVRARAAELKALVAGSVEDLSAEDVAVVVSELPRPAVAPAPPPPPWRLPAAVAAAAVALLGAGLAFSLARARRLRLQLAAPAPAQAAASPAPAAASARKAA